MKSKTPLLKEQLRFYLKLANLCFKDKFKLIINPLRAGKSPRLPFNCATPVMDTIKQIETNFSLNMSLRYASQSLNRSLICLSLSRMMTARIPSISRIRPVQPIKMTGKIPSSNP